MPGTLRDIEQRLRSAVTDLKHHREKHGDTADAEDGQDIDHPEDSPVDPEEGQPPRVDREFLAILAFLAVIMIAYMIFVM